MSTKELYARSRISIEDIKLQTVTKRDLNISILKALESCRIHHSGLWDTS